jgi:hypothetical protein
MLPKDVDLIPSWKAGAAGIVHQMDEGEYLEPAPAEFFGKRVHG